jgi:hypothetical protein
MRFRVEKSVERVYLFFVRMVENVRSNTRVLTTTVADGALNTL